MRLPFFTTLSALLFLAVQSLPAQQPWERMQFGPFLQSSVTMPWSADGEELDGLTLKGISIKLAHGASVCFDTDLLRYSGGWSGGWLSLMGTPFDGTHRPPERSRPAVEGQLHFGSGPLPGVSLDGTFRDPRPEPFGPLPRDHARYRGLSVHHDRVALDYSAGQCRILEAPRADMVDDHLVFTRTLRLSPAPHELSLLVCELRNDFGHTIGFDGTPPRADESLFAFGDLVAGHDGAQDARWEVQLGRRLVLVLPASPSERIVRVALARQPATRNTIASILQQEAEDPLTLWRSAAGRYPEVVTTTGVQGADDGPFAVDTLTLPDDNPWHSWMKIGGFDFFPGGDKAALCTWAGDVWTVEGIGPDLSSLKWRRFATGLYQPLGLRIVDGLVHVLGRDQITRLHDLNGDGEADRYECFNNDVCVTPNFHEFCFGLETDPQGRFYFSKGAPLLGTQYFDPVSRHNGCLLRVSADGGSLERIATGLRAPNGIGVGPRGEVTCGDNEGIWTPVCRLNWVREGGFYGCQGMSHRTPAPTAYDPPLCWLPFAVDNSTGGQVWVPPGSWGPLGGELLHLSYGQAALFHVVKEEVKGVMQGGVVRLPVDFASGAMRARFHPSDGQLYMVGLRGWQTRGARDGCFQRVRWTGAPPRRLVNVRFQPDAIHLTFTTPLDPELARDLDSYRIQQWNYRWSAEYGSDLYAVSDPQRVVGRKGDLQGEPVRVRSATLSPNGREVTLHTDPLQPVMQIAIHVDLEDPDGNEVIQDFYGTINALSR